MTHTNPTHENAQGLTSAEVRALQEQYGANALPRVEKNVLKEWVKKLLSPISLMLILAAALSFAVGKYFDGWFVLVLFTLNLGISFWHERKADNAIRALEERVTVRIKTLRDGTWKVIDSRQLVPGDIIELISGSAVPADALVLSGTNVSVNESALTGESLPIEKKHGDTLAMGSFVAEGIVRARVTATGKRTQFGTVMAGNAAQRKQSTLEKDILTISKFLSTIAIGIAVILSIALYVAGEPLIEILRLDLTLLIAGIPVALPVVMSVIISVGVLRLSQRAAVVRRLAALEDLANVDLLLSDKTGTLTKNEITVHEVIRFTDMSERDLAGLAEATTTQADYRMLEKAVRVYASRVMAPTYTISDYTPADSVRKRSTVLADVDGTPTRITFGAPQVIETLATMSDEMRTQYEQAIVEAGERGFRTLALAIRKGTHTSVPEEKDMELLALFLLSDELREDAAGVVQFLTHNGVGVKMLTGDNAAVAREVAGQIGLTGATVCAHDGEIPAFSEQEFEHTSVFAEILPEDKATLVLFAEKTHTVAVTGDGINDLPALRLANVGIAVASAVDALKGAADIVLIDNGIAVIRDAVIESRKIFARIYSYSLYRISESFRVIVTVALFGTIFLAPILTPIQLLLLALLNDLPIISLAFNRTRMSHRPSVINVKKRFALSMLYGTVGIINSVLFFFLARDVFHVSWDVMQTLFFLKLTVSGHMLVFVAHTHKPWFKYLPSPTVIGATVGTQIVATAVAMIGIFMTGIPLWLVAVVWAWAFFWMQVSDGMKLLSRYFTRETEEVTRSKTA